MSKETFETWNFVTSDGRIVKTIIHRGKLKSQAKLFEERLLTFEHGEKITAVFVGIQ